MRRFLILLAFFVAGSSGAPMAEEKAAAGGGAGPSAEEGLYVYKGGRFRDPFIPLNGTGMRYVRESGDGKSFDPSLVDLKGIVQAPTGRMALLKTGAGETYVVQNGKLLDGQRKAVPGYVGLVKERSLVIIGPDNQVTELKLPEKAKGITQ